MQRPSYGSRSHNANAFKIECYQSKEMFFFRCNEYKSKYKQAMDNDELCDFKSHGIRPDSHYYIWSLRIDR